MNSFHRIRSCQVKLSKFRFEVRNTSSFSVIKSMLINQNPLKRAELSDLKFQEVLDRDGIDNTTFIITSEGKGVFLDEGKGRFAELFASRSQLPHLPVLSNAEQTYIYMGAREERAFVAIDVDDAAPYLRHFPNSVLKSLRDVSERILDGDAVALLAQATGLATWHYRTKYCTKCGGRLKSTRSGSARVCTNAACGVHSYPRIEPAVIQLVQSPCKNFALLGRKKIWPAGRYSCLAGFVEIGETLEQCVVRETLEEAGVLTDIHSVKYLRSQPWPFPSSLMLGYLATAVGVAGTLPDVHVEEEEMESVKWFSKAEIRAALQSLGSTSLDPSTTALPTDNGTSLSLPGASSLARSLISEWAMLE